jgi:hypothetical protein
MEKTNILKISGEEYLLLKSLVEKVCVNAVINPLDDSYVLILDDSEAEKLSEEVQDALIREGFDNNYDVNGRGVIYENLIDKFGEIGW